MCAVCCVCGLCVRGRVCVQCAVRSAQGRVCAQCSMQLKTKTETEVESVIGLSAPCLLQCHVPRAECAVGALACMWMVVPRLISLEISRASAFTMRTHCGCMVKATADCATGLWYVFYERILDA